MRRQLYVSVVLILLLVGVAVAGPSLYKYRGADGEWVFTDRQPPAAESAEVRALPVADHDGGGVTLERQTPGDRSSLIANNTLNAPVQLLLFAGNGANRLRGQEWLLPPRSRTEVRVPAGADMPAAEQAYRFEWLPGDPAAQHRPQQPYRAPFPAAVSHRVSQAWPDAITHTTPDSAHAVDIAMPVGSNVHAARAGIVVNVASTNYRSSDTLDAVDGAAANIVRILHDDGTFAIYAHLNWNSIRVRPGQRVQRGEYIANSGNTGFSSGPHLHFVVIRNAGLRFVSLPLEFAAAGGTTVAPATGNALTAY